MWVNLLRLFAETHSIFQGPPSSAPGRIALSLPGFFVAESRNGDSHQRRRLSRALTFGRVVCTDSV